ncbi:MAG: hypothetical protein BMS9Abin05_0991 [Rhodothermia bacterium]|nr:MAG: hypothetical protein BMS9Abin05_0991 [Rhodothermia bacterium]
MSPVSVIPKYKRPKFDRDKFKALVHYVCYKAPNPKKLGATKLNKILFYSEMQSYLRSEHPIAGEKYVKRQYGPTSYHIPSILKELEGGGLIAISEDDSKVYASQANPTTLYYSLKRPDLDAFSGEEIAIIDEVVDAICNRHSAASISKASHNVMWESAEDGEELPYYTSTAYLLGNVSPEDRAWAQERIESRG